MIKHYIRVAVRAISRSKLHSTINVFGLSLGIACCVLIALFVEDEWTFDRFHLKSDRIYRVFVKEDWGVNEQFFNTTTPFPIGPVLKENFQEVEKEVRFLVSNGQVKVGNEQFSESFNVAGQNFFDVFDFPVIAGNIGEALSIQSNVVLSDRQSKKFFGDEDPVNKSISILVGESFENFNVVAVVSVPANSSLQFDILISDLNFPKMFSQRALTSGWFNVNPETYILLKQDVNAKDVVNKFPTLFKTILGEDEYNKSKYSPGLQPLTQIHLDTSYPPGLSQVSNPKYSYVLAGVAILILLVACINFVTLAVGRSIKRAREVGVRKVVGAKSSQIAI